MNDTPRTDANCGWPWGHHGRIESSDLKWSPDGPFVHSQVARELECAAHELEEENRRLHVELDAYHNEEQMRHLRAENARLQMELDGSCNAEELRQVRAEVAALRADKQRLDWLIVHASLDALVDLPGNPMKARAYIDERLHERL